MAKTWPKTETLGPDPDRENEWKARVRTQMPAPCRKNITASYTARKIEFAVATAERMLREQVRKHIRGCKKCQANNL
jgi:hypothetical protein